MEEPVTVAKAIADAMAKWASEDTSASTREYAGQLLLSCMGAMIGGSRTAAGKIIGTYGSRSRGVEVATIAGREWRASEEIAALVNGTCAHATEYEDDSFPEAVSTFTVIPPIMAVAEARGTGGRAFLDAIIIAHELQSRLGRACVPSMERGSLLLPIMGAVATAGAIAHMNGGDSSVVASALCLATSLASGLRVQSGSMAHFLESGTAGRAGVLSAELAAVGYTAEPLAFEGRQQRPGFLNALNAPHTVDLDSLSAPLEAPYRIRDVAIKVYPLSMPLQPMVEAILDVCEGVVLDDIESVVVSGNRSFADFDRPVPTTHTQAVFSLQHVAALAVVYGSSITLDAFDAGALADPPVARMRERVSVVVRDDWPSAMVRAPLSVELRTKSGESRSAQLAVKDIHGMPPDYLTMDEVVTKFERAAGTSLPTEQLGRIVETVVHVDDLKDLGELARLMGGLDPTV
jgi:2-methylcitrate dehydratase